MFNLGVNYQDCLFHMDSKIYKDIQTFFLNYYSKEDISIEMLEKHLEMLLNSILKMDRYDHGLIALIMIFQHV